jgi:hypothetical protein
MEIYGAYCDKVEVVKTVEDLSLVVEDLLRDIYADQAHPLDKKRLREAREAEAYDPKDYYTRGGNGGSEPGFDPSGRSRW